MLKIVLGSVNSSNCLKIFNLISILSVVASITNWTCFASSYETMEANWLIPDPSHPQTSVFFQLNVPIVLILFKPL